MINTTLVSIIISSINLFWTMGVLWYGLQQIIEKSFTIGGLFAFLNISVFLFQPLNVITNSLILLKQSTVNFIRFYSIYNLPEENYQDQNKHNIVFGDIEFKNVAFAYDDNIIFENLSFKIGRGNKVLLIGENGVGKTTLCKLLSKYFIPLSGDILLDNVNINDYSVSQIRKSLCYTVQNKYTFNGTIYENITYGVEDVTNEDIINAVEYSELEGFIKNLPNGYNTLIGGAKGIAVSEGEAQKIALARLFLSKPSTIILDEPSSFLDNNSEKNVLKSLFDKFKQSTIIIVSHKKDLLPFVDQVISLENKKAYEINHI